MADQLWIQFKGVATTFVWSAVVAAAAYKIVDFTIVLRVPEEEEHQGFDTSSQGETAYHV